MNWKDCSSSLQEIHLSSNMITEMNWKDCPQNLKIILLDR